MKRFVNMVLIISVYVGIMYLITLMYGCFSNSKTPKQESATVITDSSENNIEKVETALKKSDTALGNIEQTIFEHDELIQENNELKTELKKTKDSLVATKKLLKKRTLMQKILGINKDTIQKTNDTAN